MDLEITRDVPSQKCTSMFPGKVIEHSSTDDMFVTPQRRKTADYIEGRYG